MKYLERGLILIIPVLMILYHFKKTADLQTLIDQSDAQIAKIEEDLEACQKNLGEARKRCAEKSEIAKPPQPPPALAAPIAQDSNFDQPPAASSEIFVDQISTDTGTCQLATVNSDTQLAESLTWSLEKGGQFVGELPAGSIVEVSAREMHVWNDFPNEHGLFVRVRSAPRNPKIENQTGYMEMRRINFKNCNIGSEFSQ